MSEHIPVFIYTFLACLSFCVIFKFHKIPHMIAAAAGGMLSWVIYVACGFLGNDLAQYLISTIIVSAYAEVMARVFKAPVTPPSLSKPVSTPLPLPVHWQWGF